MDIMNPGEKHIACILLVDTSGSMIYDGAIDELNAGLKAFGEALKNDSKASGCADVAVISFNNTVELVQDFCPGDEYKAPTLRASGATALNEALITAMDMLEERKELYRELGIDYWRPWMFVLTDGIATDKIYDGAAHQRISEALDQGKPKFNFFPMGIGRANIEYLKSYTKDGKGMVLKASQDNFKDAFVWLSNSIIEVSNSNPSQEKLSLSELPKTITIDL